jgi:hypothetical protein
METYSKRADADIKRIEGECQDYSLRYGAARACVTWYAAKADAESARCEHFKRHPEEVLDYFFQYASYRRIIDFVSSLNDHLVSRRNYIDGRCMMDLSNEIIGAENLLFDYESDPAREREAMEDAMEFRNDCRRDDE